MKNQKHLSNQPVVLICAILAIQAIVFANPTLTPGIWTDISPQWIPKGDANNMIAQGFAFDPNNRSTLFWCNTPFNSSQYGGLFKSTNGGASWTRIGKAFSPAWMGSDSIDEPLRVRIDPNNSQHMYVGDGVRGGSLGFFVSNDGGATFNKPQGWVDAAVTAGFIDDVYDVAVDPTDFNHVLVSHHGAWKWGDAVWGNSSGVMESKDGGVTWIIHAPQSSWGTGHSIAFLYNPAKNIGNSQTWLLGTQGDGYWRTTNSGQSWTKVHANTIFHGGGSTYYSKTGVLYASASPSNLRSTDNGATWAQIGPSVSGSTCVYGDGNLLYTGQAYGRGNLPIYTSPETDGVTWSAGTQNISDSGPYEMAYDAANGIMYASMWFQGVWAMKIPGTGVISANLTIAPVNTEGNSNRIVTPFINGAWYSGKSSMGQSEVYDIKGRLINAVKSNRQVTIINIAR